MRIPSFWMSFLPTFFFGMVKKLPFEGWNGELD